MMAREKPYGVDTLIHGQLLQEGSKEEKKKHKKAEEAVEVLVEAGSEGENRQYKFSEFIFKYSLVKHVLRGLLGLLLPVQLLLPSHKIPRYFH